jgi:hypothetical protein
LFAFCSLHFHIGRADVHLRAESMRVCVRLPLSCVSASISGGSSGSSRGAGAAGT